MNTFEKFILADANVRAVLSEKMNDIATYTAPVLAERHAYLTFVKKMFDARLLIFSGQPRGRIGAFAVTKKSGKQRLVLDCRRANLLFRPPPYTELGGCAALGEMRLDRDDVLH